jgi:hypothetical protein
LLFDWFLNLTSMKRPRWFACFGSFGLNAMNSQACAQGIPSLLVDLYVTKAPGGRFSTATAVRGGVGGWLLGLKGDHLVRPRASL